MQTNCIFHETVPLIPNLSKDL